MRNIRNDKFDVLIERLYTAIRVAVCENVSEDNDYIKNLSICLGTDDPYMLCRSFYDMLKQLRPEDAEIVKGAFPDIESDVSDEGENSDFWQTPASDTLLDMLTCMLNDCSPEGYYFGRDFDNEMNFGWWPIDI